MLPDLQSAVLHPPRMKVPDWGLTWETQVHQKWRTDNQKYHVHRCKFRLHQLQTDMSR